MFSLMPVKIKEKGEASMDFLYLCLTALCSFGAMFLIAKFIGHKQVAQLDFFDYVTGITIGSIAAEMATELEEPWKPLLAMLIYGGVSWLLSVLSNHFPRMRKYLNGTPTILMDHGKLYRENFKKAKLDLSEFMVMCRQQGYFDLSSIQTAVYEYTGRLTILPVSTQRPATPQDLDRNPDQELLFTELIMDGRILEENLKCMGLDRSWLDKKLKENHISSPKDVFLAVCDRNLKFVLYRNSHNDRQKQKT
ncbi:MAG: DUF421 domain-containing protein [Oscillospiraceae bacterium]|nr:DUF421 domain-containing protein [Oscillospiraceae bacterium]